VSERTAIRPARTDDIPDLIRMGREYHAASPYSDIIAFDSASWARTAVTLIENPDGIVLMSRTGFIAGWIGPAWWNAEVSIAHEVGWRDTGGRGMDLLRAAEDVARDKGAGYILGLNAPGMRDDVLDVAYRRMGYRPAGAQFVKVLVG
jgi:hypothetical protein